MFKFLLALGLISTCICQAGYTQVDFENIVVLPKAGDPFDIKHGDVDGDGDQDVIFSTVTKPRIYVMFNEAGTLSKISTPVIPELVGVLGGNYQLPWTVGDFDNDGKDDIVLVDIVTPNANPIKLIKYNSGNFVSTTPITTSHVSARSINTADFNKDGRLDLLVVSDQIYHYEANATGGYTEKKFSTPELFAFRSVTADTNNDSFTDIIFFDTNFKISIYKNTQNGSFTFDQSIASSTTAIKTILVNDFNNDNKSDLIVLFHGGKEAFDYIKQNSDGTFAVTKITVPIALACVDYLDRNKDGKLDLVFAGYHTSLFKAGLAFLENNGANFSTSFFEDAAFSANDLTCVNLSGTTEKEIAVLNSGENILTYEVTPTLLSRLQNIPYSYFSTNSILSDLNKDGFKDLAMVNNMSGSIAIFYKNNNGEFGEPIYFFSKGVPGGIGAADFNNDSYLDVVFSIGSSSFVAGLMLGNSDGTLKEPVFLSGSTGIDIVINDFNRDGNMDFFNGVSVFFGKGDGTFVTSFIDSNGLSFSTGDYNSDNYPDLVISSISGLTLYLGKNGYAFNSGAGFLTNKVISSIISYDINGDSKIDLLSTNSDGSISKFINNNGVFSEINQPINGSAHKIVIADFDNNNINDMAVLANNEKKVLVYTGSSTGDFTFHKEFQTGPYYYYNQILANLQNNDNYIDLLLLNTLTPISILYNDFVSEPTNATKAIAISQIKDFSAVVTITPGDGEGRILTIRETGKPETNPVDNTFYSSNSKFGMGSDLGNSNYVIMKGNESSLELSGLLEGKSYELSAFEYSANNANTVINYLTTTKATISFTTKKNQTITAPSIATKTIGDSPVQLSAIASSGLMVSIQVASSTISITNSTLTVLTPGVSKVKFSQAGNSEFMPATDVVITFCVNPSVPLITVSPISPGSFLLTSSSDSNNQWLLNGIFIAGAINKTFSPVENGMYTVKVDYEGCSNTSLPTTDLITGLEGFISELTIYPNPVGDFLYVNWPDSNPSVEGVFVLDALGKKARLFFNQSYGRLTADLNTLSDGLYNLVIQTEKEAYHQKILKKLD